MTENINSIKEIYDSLSFIQEESIKLRAFDFFLSTTVEVVNNSQQPARYQEDLSNSPDWLVKLSNRLKIDSTQLQDVIYYDPTNEDVRLLIPSSFLGKSKSEVTQKIAIIFSGIRQAIGLEDETQIEEIRQKCKEYAVYDSGNFSSYIKNIDKSIILKNKTLKITVPGFEEVVRIIKELIEFKKQERFN